MYSSASACGVFFIGSGEIMAVTKAAGRAEKTRIKKLVLEAIGGIEKRLSDPKAPPTIGDYLKVMQLQKEIEEEAPKEIKISCEIL